MRIRILSIGRCKEAFVKAGIDEYLKRLHRYATVELVILKDQGVEREADDILSRLKDELVIALSEEGELLSSVGFSHLFKMPDRDIVFIIGSADGLDPRVKQRADKILSLSRMTFTHEMARLLLLEQIYRAHTILAGLPYHR